MRLSEQLQAMADELNSGFPLEGRQAMAIAYGQCAQMARAFEAGLEAPQTARIRELEQRVDELQREWEERWSRRWEP